MREVRQRHASRPLAPPQKGRDTDPGPAGGGSAPSSDVPDRLCDAAFASHWCVWAACAAFRAANALLVRTYFNPDEHWQCLEVAHRIAFGYGHLTWEWKQGIRGYLHPLIFALLYKILAFLRLDTPWFMVMAPRLFQSIFASIGDLYLYKLSAVLFNRHVARWALFCQMLNWFMFFCITRTLSNSLETVLTMVGLYYWYVGIVASWKYKSNKTDSVLYKSCSSDSRRLGLFVAGLACAIRPTSAITWLYVGLLDLMEIPSKLRFVFCDVLPVGILVLALSSILDWWMYGKWIIVPLNFIKFNFLSSGGDYYGTHVFHWYFTQGFPAMIGTFLPFSIFGIIKSKEWRFSGLILWVLGVYSILGHKEFRFVLPVLPLVLMFSGYYLAEASKPDSSGQKTSRTKHNRRFMFVLLLVITNVPMAFYMSLFHQRGTEDAMLYLSEEARNEHVNDILFLMPCHSTPYYSTLHRNITMRFLDCTPSDSKGLIDESDRFLTDPHGFTIEMLRSMPPPSHIVVFESEERHLLDLLLEHSYEEGRRFFHSHFKVDRDLQSSVAVYIRMPVMPTAAGAA